MDAIEVEKLAGDIWRGNSKNEGGFVEEEGSLSDEDTYAESAPLSTSPSLNGASLFLGMDLGDGGASCVSTLDGFFLLSGRSKEGPGDIEKFARPP